MNLKIPLFKWGARSWSFHICIHNISSFQKLKRRICIVHRKPMENLMKYSKIGKTFLLHPCPREEGWLFLPGGWNRRRQREEGQARFFFSRVYAFFGLRFFIYFFFFVFLFLSFSFTIKIHLFFFFFWGSNPIIIISQTTKTYTRPSKDELYQNYRPVHV